MTSREDPAIRDFILRNVDTHPSAITALTMEKFDRSRPAIHGYLQRLIGEGLIQASGATRNRHYSQVPLADIVDKVQLSHGLSEDAIWRFKILPSFEGLPANVRDICQYGFTEMLNNAIDHSGSNDALISLKRTYSTVEMMIADYGIGIFQKIQTDFQLPDARAALLELSKGSITSDRRRHAGEGIFFTSRMFDIFSISSGSLFYRRSRKDDDEWLIETEEQGHRSGTCVLMTISSNASWTIADVFDRYRDDHVRFRRTHVPIALSAYPGEQLVSRSQAKRILVRFDQFQEVFLDFQGVEFIGQGFADEIFRVFSLDHPDVQLVEINANAEIRRMIEHVRRDNAEDQLRLL